MPNAPTHRPERRNRNIGTKAAGYKRSNKMRIPEPWLTRDGSTQPHATTIGAHQTTTQDLLHGPVTFLHEPPRTDCTYGCSPDDVAQILANVPADDIEGLKIIAFRQPTRKQHLLNPVWGRLFYHAEFGPYTGPAIVIEAQDLTAPIRWPRKLSLADQDELARLRDDGHRVEEDRRGYTIHLTENSVRQTILHRTFPHELGHWVDWLTKVQRGTMDERTFFARPTAEREAFAHTYATNLTKTLRTNGVLS